LAEWDKLNDHKQDANVSMHTSTNQRLHTDITQDSAIKDANKSKEEVKKTKDKVEDIRRQRLRTEKAVAFIAKENPKLLDLKSKEILFRIDNQHIRRNNQLESLDVKPKLKRSTTDDHHQSLISGPYKPKVEQTGKLVKPRKDTFENDRLRLFSEKNKDEMDVLISVKRENYNYDSPYMDYSNQFRTSTEIKQKKELHKSQASESQSSIRKRDKELDDLLMELNGDSESGTEKVKQKPRLRLDSDFSDLPDTSNLYETKPSDKTSIRQFQNITVDLGGLKNPPSIRNLNVARGETRNDRLPYVSASGQKLRFAKSCIIEDEPDDINWNL